MTGPSRDMEPSGSTKSVEPSEDGECQRTRFRVPGMDCPSCARTISRGLSNRSGIERVETAPAAGRVTVEYDPAVIDESEVADAIESVGYSIVDRPGDGGEAGADTTAEAGLGEGRSIWLGLRAIKTWISGVFLVAGLVVTFLLSGLNTEVVPIFGTPHRVSDLLFFAGTIIGGEVILRNGYQSARERSMDIQFLMSVAILGAVSASLFFGEALYFEAAALAFLFNLAELLETRSMDRARNTLEELIDLSPETARIIQDGEESVVPVGEVEVGQVVAVKPGEQIPVDGIVTGGDSAVDQSPVTGESIPVDKTPGDEVYAGTLVESGYLEVETTAGADEHTLARIIDLVEDAERGTTQREIFVNRFAAYYTPVVVGLAIVAAIVPPLLFGASQVTWFVYGLTLLVLACPCAFVISTPVSVVSGITSAARNGVLIKGGNYLEAMGELEAVALDKTGTLTTGELTVTDVIPVDAPDEAAVLRCARGLEARSEHPIGEAIVDHASEQDVDQPDVEAFEAITGRGVQAKLGGVDHFAGKPGLFSDLGFDLSHVHVATDGGIVTEKSRALCERHECLDLLAETIPTLQSEGKTVVLVGTEDELEGIIALADRIRPGAATLVERLHDLGVERVVMLTGDNEQTARAIGEEVGVDEVRAGLLPEEKLEAIDELKREYDGVAMVGDGINDAPALARSTVGIAMGAAGTDTALETADIALMADDVSKLPYLRGLAMKGNSVIRQNIWASLGVKAGLVVLVPFGYVPIWVAVLIGDAGMTVGVTANAFRLSRLTP